LKNLIVITSLIFALTACNKKVHESEQITTENDWTNDNLYGQVEKIEQFRANVIDFDTGEIEEPIISQKKKYTKFGKISYQEEFDVFGVPTHSFSHKYDENGIRTNSITEDYQVPSKSVETVEFDANSNLTKVAIVFNDTAHLIAEINYDTYNNPVELTQIENGDTSYAKIVYEYSTNGKILKKKQIWISEDSKPEDVTEYKYDQRQRLIERSFKSAFVQELKKVFEYNNDWLKHTSEYNSGEIEKVISFDKDKNPINERYYSNAKLNKELKYEYSYDKIGNWIKKKVYIQEHFANNKKVRPIYVETRKIKYY